MFRKHKRLAAVRQIIPLLFFLGLLSLFVAGLLLQQPVIAWAGPALYARVLTVASIAPIPKTELRVATLVPLAIFTIHAAYTVGMSIGLAGCELCSKAFENGGRMAKQRR